MEFLDGSGWYFVVPVGVCVTVLSIAGFHVAKSFRTQGEQWEKVLKHLTKLETKQPKTVEALADVAQASQIELAAVRKLAEEAKSSAASNRMRLTNLKKQLAGDSDSPEVVQTQTIRLPGMME